jgi:hypothetical protein
VRLFGNLFGTKPDPLMKQAESLVQAAHINAVSSFVPFLDQFDVLREVNPQQWDVTVTIAGVFTAVTRLWGLRLGDTREGKLSDTISECLVKWNSSEGVSGFNDCKAIFEIAFDTLTSSGHEPRFVASDAIGSWIVWNVLLHAPETEDERRLIRAVGAMVIHRFFDWWSEQA